MKFKFLNIPVYIHPTFWLFLLFFTNIYRSPSIESLIVGAVMFFSLLVHEYGHALTARYFGADPSITLEAFGGYAEFSTGRLTLMQRFLITLNGPLFESILIFLPYFLLKAGVYDGHPYIQYLLQVTMRLNMIWCLLNLIPVTPLDGGNLLRFLLVQKFGEKGERASLIIGLVSVCIIVPYLFMQGVSFFACLLVLMGFQNFQILKQMNRIIGKNNPFSRYQESVHAIQNNDLEKAKTLLKTLLKSKDNKVKDLAIESMAKIHLKENASELSYQLLMKTNPDNLTDGKVILSKLAFERQNYQLVTKYALDTYNLEPTFENALMNSHAFAQMNDPELASGWLTTASQFGPDQRARVEQELKQPVFALLKDHQNIE
ncbi:MAG: site-2 protease family protein [Chlamydiales bacterium]